MSSILSDAHAAISSPPHPGFIELAQKLQEVAEALLCLYPVNKDKEGQGEPGIADAPQESPAEYRTYRLPGYMLEEEREMLEMYDAKDWQELLHITRAKLEILSQLMRNFDDGEQVNGFFLNQIAEHMMGPAMDMLNGLCSLVADFRLPEEEEV